MASWFNIIVVLLSPRSAPRRGVFLAMTAALLGIGAIFAFVMVDAREDARRAAESSGLNLATALAEDLARNIELLDLSIQAARDSWQVARVRALDPELRQMVVFDHSASARYIDAILVVGPDGAVLADSRGTVDQTANLRGEDFFRAQADHDAGLFISRPLKSAEGSLWSMAFSRRINAPDGSFAGVAVGFLRLDYLAEVYRRLPLGDGGVLVLFNLDGTLLVREPMQPGTVGRTFRGQAVFDRLGAADQGAFEGVSGLDGRTRLYTFHRVGGLPLVQAVATSTTQAFADWRRKAWLLGGMTLLLCAGTLVLMFLLKSELAQRVTAEKALVRWATRDDLTGLLNRRRFFELAEARCAMAARAGVAVSVLMIDADHFKSFNDRYGHLAGDTALVAIGGAIEGEMRHDTDLAARFGGEEFIVLLAGADRPQAFVVAETIRTAVATAGMRHERSAAGIVTVSIGLATSEPGTPIALSALVEAADAELYRSKSGGRNRSTAAVLAARSA